MASSDAAGWIYRILARGGGELVEEEGGGLKGGFYVGFEDGFLGVVAEAGGAAEEEHGGGHAGGHDHGVVACSAGEVADGVAGLLDGCGQGCAQGWVHGGGWLVEDGFDFAGEVAGLGYGFCGLVNGGGGFEADLIFFVAEVQGGFDLGGDYVAGVGFDLEFAHGGYEAGSIGGGDLLDLGDPLGGGGEGVVAE